MTYRDDADALLSRATDLQREVDEMREQLAERDHRLAELRPSAPWRRMAEEPEAMPEAAALIERLMDSAERADDGFAPGDYPTFPAANPPATVELSSKRPPPTFRRDAVVDRTHELLRTLSDERLVLIGAILESLVDAGSDTELVREVRRVARLATGTR